LLKFTIEGRTYDYDETSMPVKEARLIKKHTGFGIVTMANGLREGDPDALVAMIFLAKRRAGEVVRWQDLDDLDLSKLVIVPGDDDEENEGEAEAGDASDPSIPTDD
jgi:hypothetical protein